MSTCDPCPNCIAQIKAEALREAADDTEGVDTHRCFRPQGCVDCGRQYEREARVNWLRARADRIAAKP